MIDMQLDAQTLALPRDGVLGAARAVLDRYGTPGRLRYVGEYIWRGGTLRLDADAADNRPPSVWYELRAQWAAPIFEPLPSPGQALTRADRPVLEGRWIRGSAGYVLRIGLDLGVPSAICIRSERPLSNVPFLNRPRTLVEHALGADVAAYVEWFLDTCAPVPQAAQAAAQLLRQNGLEA
jgi:hypothetical protein